MTKSKTKKLSLDTVIAGFDSISLEQLNHSMALMERKEYKFLITHDLLPKLISMIKEDYKILTINEKQVFEYENVYFDSDDYMFYHQHNSDTSRSKRTKLRTRHYLDADDLIFFEFKQKTDGQMRKYRYKIPESEHGKVTEDAKKFVQKLHQDVYGEKLDKEFTPSLRNSYKRMTFCSKDNSERITVDYDIRFHDPKKKGNADRLENVAIIESKAVSQPAPSYEIFKELGLEQQDACSKYCIGLNFLDKVEKNDHFTDTLEKIAKLQENAEAIIVNPKQLDAKVQASFNNAS